MEREFERFLRSLQQSITPISERLFLGNKKAALDAELLRAQGIAAVVQVQDGTVTPFHGDAFSYHCIALVDCPDSRIVDHLPAALRFIQGHLAAGRGVFVHCDAGISRSSSVVLAYLMAAEKISFEEAYSFLKEKRACVCPNRGFEQQLRALNRETLDSWIS